MVSRDEGGKEASERSEGRRERSAGGAVCSMHDVQLLFADDDCPASLSSAEGGISPPPLSFSAPNIRLGTAGEETKKGRIQGTLFCHAYTV